MERRLPLVPLTTTATATTLGTRASIDGTAPAGTNSAAISMEKLLVITAATPFRFQTTAARLPLVPLTTTAMATNQAIHASTNGTAPAGTNSAVISMEKPLVMKVVSPSPSPAMAGRLLSVPSKTMAMETNQAIHAFTNGTAPAGTNSAATLMASLPMITAATGFPYPATAPSLPLAQIRTALVAAYQAPFVSINGMAAPGVKSAVISMERRQMTILATPSRYRTTAAPSPLVVFEMTEMEPMLAT